MLLNNIIMIVIMLVVPALSVVGIINGEWNSLLNVSLFLVIDYGWVRYIWRLTMHMNGKKLKRKLWFEK